MDLPPEHPDESLFELIELLWEAADDNARLHGKFSCRGKGRKAPYYGGPGGSGNYQGCPKCRARTGDPFTGWKIQQELDYLCDRKDPNIMPDFLLGEEL